MHRALIGTLVVVSLVGSPLRSQTHQPLPRWGVVAGFGVGRGSGDVTCGECRGSQGGPSMHGRVGGALREDLYLVAELDGFSSSENRDPLAPPATSLLALDVVAQWYPRSARGYFLSAGLGGGRVETNSTDPFEDTITSPIGWAFKVGTGYDIRVTRAFAVTPFASFVHVASSAPKGFTQRMNGHVLLFGVEANLITRELLN